MDLTDMITRPPARKDVRTAGAHAPEIEEDSAGFRAVMDRETGTKERVEKPAAKRQSDDKSYATTTAGNSFSNFAEPNEQSSAGQLTNAVPSTSETPVENPVVISPTVSGRGPDLAIPRGTGTSQRDLQTGDRAALQRARALTNTNVGASPSPEETAGATPTRHGTPSSSPTAPIPDRPTEPSKFATPFTEVNGLVRHDGAAGTEAARVTATKTALPSTKPAPRDELASTPMRVVVRHKVTEQSAHSTHAGSGPRAELNTAASSTESPAADRPSITTKTTTHVAIDRSGEASTQGPPSQRVSLGREARLDADPKQGTQPEANAPKQANEPSPKPSPSPALKAQASSSAAATGLVSTDANPASVSVQSSAQGTAQATQAPSAPVLPTSPAHPPSMVERNLLPQLTAAAGTRANGGSVEVLLDPPELGRVEITMDLSEQGLRATLSAERQSTMDLLRRHLEMLTQQFEEAGFSNIDLEFSTYAEDGSATILSERVGSEAPERSPEHDAPARSRIAGSGLSADTLVDLRL